MLNNNAMTDLRFLQEEIICWKASKLRLDQYTAEKYYMGYHDILSRQRTTIGTDGLLQVVENLPNNKIIDNQYAKVVDQKKNYLLSKTPTFETKNDKYKQELDEFLNMRFLKTLKNVGEAAINHGIGYMYLYYNELSEFKLKQFKAYEILPFWEDEEHTDLDSFIRVYEVEEYQATSKVIVEKAEWYTKEGIHYFDLIHDVLSPTAENPVPYFKMGEQGYNWKKVPLIAFKANNKEQPLINKVKSLQDAINTMQSDFMNNMQEDARNTIIVLKNYDGTNLAEFRHNLATYGAVKVKTIEGSEGGVDTLQIEVNAENYKVILDLLKKALVENARAFDSKLDKLGGSPNEMNIQSMYSDMDLDANDMETEFQAAFEELFWFFNVHLGASGKVDLKKDRVNVIFNRDILINESQTIENCKNSVGIISSETIVSQHPYVKDVTEELKRIEDEKKKNIEDYTGAFNPVNTNITPEGGDGVAK